MKFRENSEYICCNCKAVFSDETMLKSKNPFDENDTIVGCPNCKAILNCADYSYACDVENCNRARWFTITIDGKVRDLCDHHYNLLKDT